MPKYRRLVRRLEYDPRRPLVRHEAGVWSTPDAYKGEIHDSMSQKPYMWNGNNPYEFSDPSGYKSREQTRNLGPTPDSLPGIVGYRAREEEVIAKQIEAQRAGSKTIEDYENTKMASHRRKHSTPEKLEHLTNIM